jgi:hypothetical protein
VGGWVVVVILFFFFVFGVCGCVCVCWCFVFFWGVFFCLFGGCLVLVFFLLGCLVFVGVWLFVG